MREKSRWLEAVGRQAVVRVERRARGKKDAVGAGRTVEDSDVKLGVAGHRMNPLESSPVGNVGGEAWMNRVTVRAKRSARGIG